jgi:hypothetical protein
MSTNILSSAPQGFRPDRLRQRSVAESSYWVV